MRHAAGDCGAVIRAARRRSGGCALPFVGLFGAAGQRHGGALGHRVADESAGVASAKGFHFSSWPIR